MRNRVLQVTLPVCAAIFITCVWLADASPPTLNPPAGSVALSGRFGPRIGIRAADLPLTINQAGSYYLAENVTTTGGGITIAADDVELDLMGHTLCGGTSDGIFASGTRKNIVIKNGTLSDWSGDGVDAFNASNSQFEGLRVFGNSGVGLRTGDGAVVSACTAESNESHGIEGKTTSTFTKCTARLNSGDGFVGSSHNSFRQCAASSNTGAGMRFGFSATVSGCSASSNGAEGFSGHESNVFGCFARNNGGSGFSVGSNSVVHNCGASFDGGDGIAGSFHVTVVGCTAAANGGDGIDIAGDCTVVGNTCGQNGTAGIGAGIHASAASFGDNRIEGNNVTRNDIGIDVDGAGNLIIRNSASGNTSGNFSLASGNHYGQIVSNPGSGFTNSNSWANFEY
ncbi:MAG: right-handed parallel beta-helix repeat-containing protein [Phycisphaerales bacterium]|nr:right-handed parallel beta-helix repeat-containing protein [Phycisphaerales bacterium]